MPPSLNLKKQTYCHVTYNEPPNKSFSYGVLNKLLDTMKEKGKLFSFLVGYFPTYKLIFELQTENPDKFLNIATTIGALSSSK